MYRVLRNASFYNIAKVCYIDNEVTAKDHLDHYYNQTLSEGQYHYLLEHIPDVNQHLFYEHLPIKEKFGKTVL
jgi:hypothetical protein